jgi:hypothetical protein
MPSTTGTAVTLTASGVLSGKTVTTTKAVTTVSATPTFSVTSPVPVNGVIYSNTGTVVFNGQANVSVGYASTVKIASVGYKIGSNPWQTAPISSLNKVLWSLAATFPAGLNSIKFNATDANGNTFVSQAYSVLVDSSAPTITATTKSGSSINATKPVVFTIVDTEGDLNATSVVGTSNSTATLTTTVTGSNSLGNSVTYTVNVNGLPTGHWSVTLNAKDYAKNAASAVTVIVKVVVAFALSATITGAAKSVIGGYTGISATVTNSWTTTQNLVMIAVWTNSAGQPVCVGFGSLTLAAGASASAFAGCLNAPASGTYTVNVFIITTANQGVSSKTTLTVTL